MQPRDSIELWIEVWSVEPNPIASNYRFGSRNLYYSGLSIIKERIVFLRPNPTPSREDSAHMER